MNPEFLSQSKAHQTLSQIGFRTQKLPGNRNFQINYYRGIPIPYILRFSEDFEDFNLLML